MVANKNSKAINVICLLIATLIWGSAFISQKVGGQVMGAYTFNVIRFLIGAVVLIPVILLTGGFKKQNVQDDAKSSKKLWVGGILCGLALAVATNFQQLGINLGSTVGNAGFLTTCYIVFVPVLGLIIKVRIKILEVIGVILALPGMFLLCFKEEVFSLQMPDLLLLLCALCFAIQILLIDHFAPNVNVVKLSCVQFLCCSLVSLIPMVLVDMQDINMWLVSIQSKDAWGAILYAGIMSSGIAYTLQMRGQKNFSPSVASLIMSLESVFSLVFGAIIFREKLSTREYAGCILIFAAVIIAQIDFKKKDSD